MAIVPFLHDTKAGHVILAVAGFVAAKYLLDLVAALNRFILVGNRRARRAMEQDRRVGLTVSAVLISLARYFLYFILLGWVLVTLGVKLTQYLASVSFIAIALGFGVQGLVQDVVTGFFLIFERQLDVGDMVSINGQTGLVEDFGLRFMELRLFDGSHALIPNRTIMQVINYRSRGLRATIDVVLTQPATGRRDAVAAAQRAVAAEIQREFAGAVLQAPAVVPWTDGEGGGGFVRAQLFIWPGQTWVVDGQWTPRLTARLTAGGLDPAQFQIAVHYHGDHTINPRLPTGQGIHWRASAKLNPQAGAADRP